MDVIAEALGMDPIELRLKNAFVPGDLGMAGTPFLSCELEACLEKGAELIGWENRKAAGSQPGTVKRGLGVATELHSATAYPETRETANAVVVINEDGTVQLRIGAADLGTGAKTVCAQVAAEELGVRFEDIRVMAGDTDVVPYDLGAYASRTTFLSGGATQRAAAAAREQLFVLAAAKLGVSASELESCGGKICVKNAPDKTISFREVVQPGPGQPSPVIMGQAGFAPRNDYSFAAQFAEVEVDTETGQTRVLRMVAVHDIGRAINPAGAEGQVEGGLHQGIGYALIEDMAIDPRTGRTLNAEFRRLQAADRSGYAGDAGSLHRVGRSPGTVRGEGGCRGCRVSDRPCADQCDLQRHRSQDQGIARDCRAGARCATGEGARGGVHRSMKPASDKPHTDQSTRIQKSPVSNMLCKGDTITMFKKHLFIAILILVVAALVAGCAAPAAPAPAAPTAGPRGC